MTESFCTVFAPTRLHLGLIDCSDATPRRFGGVGIALEEPGVRVRVSVGCTLHGEVVGLDLDDDLARAVLAAVSTVTQEDLGVRVEFEQLPIRHVGLGTGTAARLAVAAGAAYLTGLDLSAADLALSCGRGGTSGIGVNAFDMGGVIFDGGHALESDAPFVPSRYQAPCRLPPVVARLALPPQWMVSLLYPRGVGMSGEHEHAFFQHQLPVPASESLQTLGYAYHGLAPALLECNLHAFAYSLTQIHLIGFKRRELERQSDDVRTVLSRLQANEVVAAGMSSLGPLIYAITDRQDQAANNHVRACAESAGADILLARPADGGYRIESPRDAEL